MAKTQDAKEYVRDRVRVTPSGCWEWLLAKDRDGYGACRPPIIRAHRMAFDAFVGPIPDGMCVCHRCDNRACVNPDHLFLGTNLDNIRDRDVKGRSSKGDGHRWTRISEATKAHAVARVRSGERTKDVAREFGISAVHMYRIVRAWP